MLPTARAGEKPVVKLDLRELSALDGTEVYIGEGRNDLPVSARDIRVLSVLLVGVMVVVLLVVLRREPDDGVYSLPEGISLAEPARRAFGGLIDFALAALVASWASGMPLSEVLSPAGILEGQVWVVGGMTLGAGFLIGTITEWLTGRSPGKMLAGCEVIDVRPPVDALRHPVFGQAVIRNLIKWGVFPAAVFGLMEGTGRHRGDGLSRTAVVIEGGEEEEEGEDF